MGGASRGSITGLLLQSVLAIFSFHEIHDCCVCSGCDCGVLTPAKPIDDTDPIMAGKLI